MMMCEEGTRDLFGLSCEVEEYKNGRIKLYLSKKVSLHNPLGP
jgi:hypothetical protein